MPKIAFTSSLVIFCANSDSVAISTKVEAAAAASCLARVTSQTGLWLVQFLSCKMMLAASVLPHFIPPSFPAELGPPPPLLSRPLVILTTQV